MDGDQKFAQIRPADAIQQRLASYAHSLSYDELSPEAVHTAKLRAVDTIGALIGGFFTEPPRMARRIAAAMPAVDGATILGTRLKTSADMAAFVNGTTARHVEMNDLYHRHGSAHGHPSDVIIPALAVGEIMGTHGRDFIIAIVLLYEIFLRLSDVFHNNGFDHTNFCSIASAAAAGRLMNLTETQISHAISMAAVSGNTLKQLRIGRVSMWKSVASGHASRSGVFAAMLARAGMEGPHLPFEGKAGWCDHVARTRFKLDVMGGAGVPCRKILESRIKTRPVCGEALSSILAAEKVAPIKDADQVQDVTVEVYNRANKELTRAEDKHWHRYPDSRETADQSVPFLVATTLLEGRVTLHSLSESRLWEPRRRALMDKIKVVTNEEFTHAYEQSPAVHRTRVTVTTIRGERLVGETGGGPEDPSAVKSDSELLAKFRNVAEDYFGATSVDFILHQLMRLDELPDVREIPRSLVFT